MEYGPTSTKIQRGTGFTTIGDFSSTGLAVTGSISATGAVSTASNYTVSTSGNGYAWTNAGNFAAINATGGALYLHTGGSAYNVNATLDAAGNLGIGVTPTGGINASLQIKDGIKFPATQVPSTDPNTLDDYEEGFFTPTIIGATTAGVGTYSIQTGKYTKIGNLVTISFYTVHSAHTGTGNMQLAGLPFAAAAVYCPVTLRINNISMTAGNYPQGYVNSGATTVTLEQIPTGDGSVSAISMDTSCAIMMSCTYFV
jgi:hypothetical protein